MTQNMPGYPLPSGELGEDEIVCQLVYLPDRDEYWQALFAAIHFMSTWTAWERDDSKRGKDAAANWREAFEMTVECWRMACLDDITDRMDIIIDMIGLKKDCCDDNLTYSPQTEVVTEIEPEEGDAPDYYGETAVTDWDDWLEHVCYNAHVYVDTLIHQAEQMDAATVTVSWTIGLIAAGLAALSFVGIGLAVVYGLAALTAGGLISAVTEGVFSSTASDIETARDDIVCALLQGTSLSDAVEGALSSGLDWDLFFQFADYDSATAIIYDGGYGTEYLSAETKDDCAECDEIPLDDEDLFIQNFFGSVPEYDSETGQWSGTSQLDSGCHIIDYRFWDDDLHSNQILAKVEYISCSLATTCASAKHHRGYLSPYLTLVYAIDHPTLPDVDDGDIEQMYCVHNASYDIVFKVYEV